MIISYIGVFILASAESSTDVEVTNKSYRVACVVQVLVALAYSSMIIFTRQMKALHYSVLQFNYFLFSMDI